MSDAPDRFVAAPDFWKPPPVLHSTEMKFAMDLESITTDALSQAKSPNPYTLSFDHRGSSLKYGPFLDPPNSTAPL